MNSDKGGYPTGLKPGGLLADKMIMETASFLLAAAFMASLVLYTSTNSRQLVMRRVKTRQNPIYPKRKT